MKVIHLIVTVVLEKKIWTTVPISTKLGTKQSWVKVAQDFTNKRPFKSYQCYGMVTLWYYQSLKQTCLLIGSQENNVNER